MAEYPRIAWAVPVAQHVADAVRLLRARRGDIEADIMLEDIDRLFRRSIMAIGTVGGGPVQREVERLILEDGLTVEAALDKVGC